MKFGVSYFGNRIHRHVEADMKRLASEGFNLVCHTFSENDYLFYRETMKDLVQISKDHGMETYVDPWGVGKVFGGEAFSNFVATNLDCLQILSDDKPAGMACPMNPRFREFIVEWIEAALETGADMIFWDEPHFSISSWIGGRKGQWGCRCPICQEKFYERFGYGMPKERTEDVSAYLEWGIFDFLSFAIGETKKRGGKNALCLLPHDPGEEASTTIWDKFAQIEGLDVFGTDPYFELQKKDISHVRDYCKVVMDACASRNLEPQIWFQAFKIARGREPLQAEAVQIAYDAGVRNLCIWGIDACHHISWIRPDDAETVWKTFVDKFAELRG